MHVAARSINETRLFTLFIILILRVNVNYAPRVETIEIIVYVISSGGCGMGINRIANRLEGNTVVYNIAHKSMALREIKWVI